MNYFFIHIKMSYYYFVQIKISSWFNRQELLQKAKYKYHNCVIVVVKKKLLNIMSKTEKHQKKK